MEVNGEGGILGKLLHKNMFYLLLFLSLLSFQLIPSLVTKNIYVVLCIHLVEFLQFLVLWRSHLFFCDDTYKFHWGATSNTTCLKFIQP